MSISHNERTIQQGWKRLRSRLALLYLFVALALLIISGIGHARLISQVGQTFGGFFWGIDTDNQVVVISTPPGLAPLPIPLVSLTNQSTLTAVNGGDIAALSNVYQHSKPGASIDYTVQQNGQTHVVSYPATTFTASMWFNNYGWTLIAGLSWLLVGGLLLATALEWTGAVEGITLLPPAMLFLLYSHWGNAWQAYQADLVFQLLWIPSFALLGAAFIQLSLTYRPGALKNPRKPRLLIDGLPYLPILALLAFDLSSLLIKGSVPTRLQLILALSYAVFGGVLSLCIGLSSLARILVSSRSSIVPHIRRRLIDLLTLWIGGVGLGLLLGILPILLTGQTLVPLQVFYLLAAVYPLVLMYAIRSLRMIDRLEVTLEQREEVVREQQKTAEQLLSSNRELQQATSLLLNADAHLRSIISQRIHDQPKQQALRIRSLLGHWQHKLKLESEQNPAIKPTIQPVIEALGKVRKISEELEGDLRGLQLLVEDSYQRRNLGLKLHLEKLISEDLPALHPESMLIVKPNLYALDELNHDLEATGEGQKFAEAISYTVTQALLNIYNHAGASLAIVRATRANGGIEIMITDDGRGFDINTVTADKTSLFKAKLKAREAGGLLTIRSVPRPRPEHGTIILLRLPLPPTELSPQTGPLSGSLVREV
ncbi:MAG: sensor histidine kinase [Ktedonobacteraceae bacterium]